MKFEEQNLGLAEQEKLLERKKSFYLELEKTAEPRKSNGSKPAKNSGATARKRPAPAP
jgi:hypothetical protein